MSSRQAAREPSPARIVLDVRAGCAPSAKPAVRIFLGTEPAQHRAERIFVWSIEQVRDPCRVYEIHLMRDLPGFQSSRWTTGFTNYRFAIPHFAAGAGRALYNDVDQVYLADPAELFDSEMGEHGYLAISPEDPSVMLIDCARMQPVWTLEAAQQKSKSHLIRRARTTPGLFGTLAPQWNARDDEYVAGQTKVLHFTTLATQPWRPFPDRFVYDEHPLAGVFFDLERSADERGFQLFSRQQPSPHFAAWLDQRRSDSGCDTELLQRWEIETVRVFDPATPPPDPSQRSEAIASCGVLDDVPADDLPWIFDELARSARKLVHVAVACDAPLTTLRPMGVPPDTPRAAEWWRRRFEAAVARHRDLHWQLVLQFSDGHREIREAGKHIASRPPSVWMLADDRPGCTSQSAGLAEKLGWPTQIKHMRYTPAAALHNRLLGASRIGAGAERSSPLEPPWPDLVIAAGRRNAPVAQWIRKQDEGRTRLVQLGRKGGDAAERFDLAVTPSYARLFPHPNRVEIAAPLHLVNEQRLSEAADRWKERLSQLKTPRIAVLVGGTSGQYHLGVETARRLGEDVARMARQQGGSLMATTSRRTGKSAAEAFRSALDVSDFVYLWEPTGVDNPYLALLALADAFVVTGDSESMIGEAISLSRPVYLYPLPTRRSFSALRLLRNRIEARARSRSKNRRGTARPQKGLEYLCARLIDRGFVRPARELGILHEDLIRRGIAHRFGDRFVLSEHRPVSDVEVVAARVRSLMGAA